MGSLRRERLPPLLIFAHQRHVAIQDERMRIIGERGERLLQRMTSTELWLLPRPEERLVGNRLTHALAAMTVNGTDARR